MSAPINQMVRELAALRGDERAELLQRLIGDPVTFDKPAEAKRVLHDRALLITRLNNAGVWPPR